jgi:3-methylfumaryl-CoA hydratase
MSMAANVDIDALRRHVGKTIEEHDVATAAPLHGLIVTFDRDEPPPKEGDIIQPGWHGAYFLQMSRKAKLGADGLPVDSALLPPMPFPRRMYAGADLAFHEPIRVGDRLRRVSELTDISLREGSTGALIFVTQTRSIFMPRGLAVVDRWHTVFREEVPAGQPNAAPKRDALQGDLPWRRTIEVDPVSLFRYSALTFNPHRIHYDRGYATTTEGYPGLVVHGPYSQQCLLDFARDHMQGRTMKTFTQRARAPLFDTAPFTLVGRPIDEQHGAEIWALTHEGTIAMQAKATCA